MNNQIIKFHLQHETLPVRDYTDYTKQSVSQKSATKRHFPVRYQSNFNSEILSVHYQFSQPTLVVIRDQISQPRF